MDIRRRNEITIGVLMAFGINMMLGAVFFGALMFIATFTIPEYFNPRWAMIFPFVLLFITGILTGVIVMLLRFGKTLGAITGLVIGTLTAAFFVFLMPEWAANDARAYASSGGTFVFGSLLLVFSLGVINAISGTVAAMKNKK
jgi:drug/metabolite transporter superfamily protein YnfA